MLFSLSGCACVAHVLRVRSATHARLSRFSTLALCLIISLFQTRSAPRPRLSRLLPFALWQVTSLQAKKQCSRRTTKHGIFAVLFLCQAVGKVLTYLCTFRSLSSPSSTCAPCSAFGQRLARDNNSAIGVRFLKESQPDTIKISRKVVKGKIISGVSIENKKTIEDLFGMNGIAKKVTRFNVQKDNDSNNILIIMLK